MRIGSSILHAFSFLACSGLVMSCSASEDNTSTPTVDDGRRVPTLPAAPGGKADSYVNSAARELAFSGSAHMATPSGLDAMTPEEADAALAQAADKRLSSVASAIVSYLREQARTMNSEIPDELPPEIAESIADKDESTKRRILENWQTQQEVSAATRSSNKHLESIRQDNDGSYLFDFEVEGLLSNKLADKLFSETRTFEVTVTQYTGEPASETITVEAKNTPSTDGYPHYDELFADGVLDVALHIGGDYNKEQVQICCPNAETGEQECREVTCQNSCEPLDDECSQPAPDGCTVEKLGGRIDRWTAKQMVEILKEQGFAHEAESYLDLEIDSPPFTKTYDFAGMPVEVRFKIVYPEIVPCGEEQKLVDAMKDSLATREVVIYAGHAGPGAGYVLDYQPRTELDDSVWKTLTMPETYQILFMYGCQTYSTYADAMYANPAKNDANLNVVSTVNTMWTNMGLPGTTTVLFSMLMQETESTRHIPVSWLSLLGWLNLQEQNAHTHYGIHGVDSCSKMSPWVTPEDLCAPCEVDTDCPGGGNYCLQFPDGGKGCGAVCTDDSGCGSTHSCVAIPGLESSVIPKMCVPNDMSCQ